MKKPMSDQSGFSTLVILTVTLVIVVLVASGWVVYQHHQNNVKTKNSVATTSPQTTRQQKSTTSTQPAQSIYAGWKTFCDTVHYYCFKYPSNWILATTTNQTTVLNAAKSVEVDYINPYVHDSGLLTFEPVSVNDLMLSGVALKIVGGVYSPANEPDYGIVDASLLATYPVTIGQSTNFPNALRFADMHAPSSSDVAFRAKATSPLSSQSVAQAWFNTDDAKTSLQILQSLYYQH